jgi:hypothetical protein
MEIRRCVAKYKTLPSRVADKLYQENDKIMLLTTGEVFTVLIEITDEPKSGIFVKEKILAPIKRSEVRPAGRTRERQEAGMGITEPDSSPPPLPAGIQL